MDNRDAEAIQKISEFMEMRVNETMKDVMDQYDLNVALNVLVSVATSMMAKALLMTEHHRRDHLQDLVHKITQSKLEEGHAAVESMVAIGKAMLSQGGAFTCRPTPPKKH
jgi:hypothetical protein